MVVANSVESHFRVVRLPRTSTSPPFGLVTSNEPLSRLKLPEVTEIDGDSTSDSLIRASSVGSPSGVQSKDPKSAFGVLSVIVSHVTPASRESSILTLLGSCRPSLLHWISVG